MAFCRGITLKLTKLQAVALQKQLERGTGVRKSKAVEQVERKLAHEIQISEFQL